MRESEVSPLFRGLTLLIALLVLVNVAIFSVKYTRESLSNNANVSWSTIVNTRAGLKLISKYLPPISKVENSYVTKNTSQVSGMAAISYNHSLSIFKSSFSFTASAFRYGVLSSAFLIRSGVTSIFHGFTSATSFAMRTTRLTAYIQPASALKSPRITVPVLSTASSPSVQTSSPAASPVKQASSPQPTPPAAPAPAPPVKPLSSVGDPYAWGNCTWWVYMLRAQINKPIPGNWGNAANWAYSARRVGYVVNHTPTYGAIMQTPYVDYGLGHVAFVEGVNTDGSWRISEMNVLGLDLVDHKTMPAAAAAEYNFIQ